MHVKDVRSGQAHCLPSNDGERLDVMRLDRWTTSWLVACATIVLHVTEEAFNGSFGFYSDLQAIVSVISPDTQLRPFQFQVWLLNIVGAVGVLFALTPLVQARKRIMVIASFILSIVMAANATAHIAFSLLTRHVLAGAPTSFLMLLAALYLMVSVPENAGTEVPKRT